MTDEDLEALEEEVQGEIDDAAERDDGEDWEDAYDRLEAIVDEIERRG